MTLVFFITCFLITLPSNCVNTNIRITTSFIQNKSVIYFISTENSFLKILIIKNILMI